MSSWIRERGLLTLVVLLAYACAADDKTSSLLGSESRDGDAGEAVGDAPPEHSAGDAAERSSSQSDAGEPALVMLNEPPKTCADITTTPERTIPSVTFLVDGSGSMDCVYPEDPACSCEAQLRKQCVAQGSQSRWQALSQALLGTANEPGLVGALAASVRFGVWVYNNAPGAPVCPGYPVKIDPALNQTEAIRSAFPAKAPGYNTPTARALAELSLALPSAEEAKQRQLGAQKIVLATDGQPFTCQDPVTLDKPALDEDAVLAAARGARGRGIDLFVMSLAPASGEFASHLAELAQQGNTARPYAPANQVELRAALEDIIASAISCSVRLDGTVPHPEQCRGRAVLGGAELGCGDADGFAIRDSQHVELLGEACRRFKHEPGIALQMTFPCDGFGLE